MSWLWDWMDSHCPHLSWSIAIVWILVLSLMIISGVRPVTAAGDEVQHIALYVIIDSSGSMKSSDPLNLRWTAVRLLVSLLDEGDEVAILAFNSDDPKTPQREQPVIPFLGSTDRPYGPLIRIGRDTDKGTLLADLDYFADMNKPDGNTDMLAAFKAAEPLVRQARSDSHSYLIFLTDGLPVAPNWQPDQSELGLTYEEALLQQVSKLNVPLFAGGLWPKGACEELEGDVRQGQELLQQMVSVAPGGQARCISGAAELPAFFLESFGRIADRHYRRLEDSNRFEVREDQEGIIQTLTLIYVEDEIGCRDADQSALCVAIYGPDGRQLTPADLSNHNELEAWLDDDFIVVTVRNPDAGSWLVDGDPERVYVILQTRLRAEIVAPEVGVSRHAVHEPLPVHVRLFQVSDNGVELPLPEGYVPTFLVQTLRLVNPPNRVGPLTLNLVYDPTHGTYESRTPPLEEEGDYLISLEVELGGFKIVKDHRVYVRRFPQLKLEGIPPDGVIHLLHSQQAEINLVPYLNEQIEPITELDAEDVRVRCSGQPVTSELDRMASGQYVLAFMPPQQSSSQCELQVEGMVRHLGAPYFISLDRSVFEIALMPELFVETQNKDFGEVLPFNQLVITGTSASLFGEESATIMARLKRETRLDINVSPESILPGEETPLLVSLTPKPAAKLPYGYYEDTIVLESSQDVLISGKDELRFTFTLIQPSVTHDITENGYTLEQPFSDIEDESVIVPFRLVPQLSMPGKLSVTLTDEAGNPLAGITPKLSTMDILADKEQTYQLRLQRRGKDDPWPASWLRPRPIAFNVALNAGSEVQVLPTGTFRVAGTRRSRLDTWWVQTATTRAKLGQFGLMSGLMLAGLWAVITSGWMLITRWQHVELTELLVPVRVSDDKSIREQSSGISLSGYNGLKQRLFGIRFRVGSQAVSRPPFRLFPPEDFWAWLLRAHEADFVEPEPGSAEFRLYAERGLVGEQRYQLVNLGEPPLHVRKATGSDTGVEFQTEMSLKAGDIILIGEDRGFQLGESQVRVSTQQEKQSPRSMRRRVTGSAAVRKLSVGDPQGGHSETLKRRTNRRVQSRSRRETDD
jgi:hypothetical protein